MTADGIDRTFVVARVFTPSATYDKATLRIRASRAELSDRHANVVAALELTDAEPLCLDPGTCADLGVAEKWRLTGVDGTRWLAYSLTNCGCGGMVAGAPLADLLAW